MQPAIETPTDERSALPELRLVIPTGDVGSWFDATAMSIADQDYPSLHVTLVHDPGEAELLRRPIEALPSCDLIEAPKGTGFGAKVNMAVDDASERLILVCHDDIAFTPGAISALVREWVRRSDTPTLIAPKLVDWNDPTRLVPGGFDADRFGYTAALVRRGDLDQGQQDRVAEVFGSSTACLLIEREFFEELGGFDPAIDWHGEAHDLALRSRTAGAKVFVASAASVRHRDDFAGRGGPSVTGRERRHQMRSVFGVTTGLDLVRLIGAFVALHVVEFAVAVVRLDFGEIRSIPAAWIWNAAHLRSLVERRRTVAEHRRTGAGDLRSLRRSGSIRMSESVDRRIRLREQASERGENTISVIRTAGAVIIGLLLLFGARHLLTRTIPTVGELRLLPSDFGTLTNDWWSGWREWGMGADGSAPFALPLLDLAGVLTLGSESLLRLILVVAPIPVGVFGAWRLFGRSESSRAPVAAAALYAASPVPYNAMSNGSLKALVVYASLPWILGHLVRQSRSSVFGSARPRVEGTIGLWALLALVGAFVPWIGITFALVVVGLVVGSFLAGDMRGVPALLTVSTIALAGAALLNLPYLLEIREWGQVGAAEGAVGADFAFVDILRATTGPVGSPILGWAVFAPALFPLLVASGQRFTWALRMWGVLLISWAVPWAGSRGWLGVGLPVAEVMLVPAALGLAVLAGVSVLVIDRDLAGAKTRRLIPAVVAAAGFGLALLPLLNGSFTGRWELARVSLATGAIEAPAEEGTYRVVWIADPHVLGAAGTTTANGLAWTSSMDGAPDIRALWSGPASTSTDVLSEALTAGLDGRTSRLGRELSRFGVRYVVVVDQQAPVPEVSLRSPIAEGRAAGLASQLDLTRTGVVNPAVVVYENTAWAPVHSAVAPATLETLRLDDPAPAVVLREDHDTWTGQVRVTRNVYVAMEPSERWSLRVDDTVAPRIDVGPVGMGFETSTVGDETAAVFDYETSDSHRLIAGAQVAGWGIMVLLRRWIVGRERRRSSAGFAPADTGP